MKKHKVKPGATAAPPDNSEFSLIPNHKLLALYSALLKCRMISRRFPGPAKTSQLVSEAVAVGAAIDLLAADALSPAPHDLAPCLLKGVPLKSLLRLQHNPSARFPAAFSRANVIPPTASCLARLEAGLRLAALFHSWPANAVPDSSVVVFFIGHTTARSNSPTSEISPQQLAPLLRRAATQLLPILFIQQSEGEKKDWTPLAESCGIPGMAVDREDVVAVYRVVSEALSHARHGNGPTLIACQPWRIAKPGIKRREVRDPVRKMELYLIGKGLAFRPLKAKIAKDFAVELDRAMLTKAGA